MIAFRLQSFTAMRIAKNCLIKVVTWILLHFYPQNMVPGLENLPQNMVPVQSEPTVDHVSKHFNRLLT